MAEKGARVTIDRSLTGSPIRQGARSETAIADSGALRIRDHYRWVLSSFSASFCGTHFTLLSVCTVHS